MKVQKIRGHNRLRRRVQNWVQENLTLDQNHLNTHQYEYVKVWVHPWSGLTFKNSWVPEPRRKTRDEIVQGLAHIYHSWKEQLDSNYDEYYLRIWLNEPRISKSQVVCAIGERMEYYLKMFEPNVSRADQTPGQFSIEPDFQWEAAMDYEFVERSELSLPRSGYSDQGAYNYDRYLLKKCISQNFKSEEIKYENHTDTLFYIPRGTTWIGREKKHPNNMQNGY